MKKTIPCRLAVFGTALILSALTVFPAFAANHSGHLDTVSEAAITGWAWDSESPDTALSVELTISGENTEAAGNTVLTVSANQFREDLNAALGSGSHGFVYEIDWSGYAAGTYTVTAAAVSGETKTPLLGTITYKKEEAPAESTTAAGPTSNLSTDQIAIGPGYASGVSSNTKASTKASAPSTYGPGAASYEAGEPDQYLGSFHATAYCGCSQCSGGHALTYSGTIPTSNHTIAADLELYPIGTKLWIDGIVYTVEDKGSTVVDNRIDIYFATHAEALAFGLQNVDVYTVK